MRQLYKPIDTVRPMISGWPLQAMSRSVLRITTVAVLGRTWKPLREGLLNDLSEFIPANWQVVVMADRGVDANWLDRTIQH